MSNCTNASSPVSWNGPQGYVIILSAASNKNVRQSAEKLQKYFEDAYGIAVPVADDSRKETAKEILLGKSSRTQAGAGMAENEFSLSLVKDKPVFDAGHYLGLDKAVYRYINQKNACGSLCEFKDNFDFESKKFGKYEYVWGDEFDGDTLDPKKWAMDNFIGPPPDLKLSTDDPDVVRVEDGNLKMHVIQYSDPSDSVIEFETVLPLHTDSTMNYTYGYLETRAILPFKYGAWPALWAISKGKLTPRKTLDYFVEIDIFEIFTSENEVSPNIHKWYADKSHTQVIEGKTRYYFDDYKNLSNEYHLYGFEWTPEEMSMYVDGEKYMAFDLTKSFDDNEDMSGFQDNLFLIIDNFIYTRAGSGSEKWAPDDMDAVIANTPMAFWIDWIRLYQEPGKGELHIAQ